MTKAELCRKYRRLNEEYEKKLAEGIDDEELYEEISDLEMEISYRAEVDRF